MNTTQTTATFAPHEHPFSSAGCRWQWAADHDEAECWAAYTAHQS